MKTQKSPVSDEVQLRQIIDDWAEALRAKDIDGILANYAPDFLSFDVVPPLQHKGVEGARKRNGEWLSTFKGPINFEMRDLKITTSNEVAFCHSLNRVSGTMKDDKPYDVWVRATLCFHKLDGKWIVTHEHVSIPFDMKTGKAALDLKP
jgi:ketosteroid isomerase-like protein